MISKPARKLGNRVNGNGETAANLELRQGTVIEVDKTVSPWTITVRISEVDVPEVTMMGWYDPRPGDEIMLMQQGTMLLAMGTLAPGRIYAPVEPIPDPPAPPPAPPAPDQTSTVPVEALSSATAPAEAPYGGVRTDYLYQSGINIGQRGYWFYGDGIAAAKGSGEIIAASILIRRFHSVHGLETEANVRLGWHGLESQIAGLENEPSLSGVFTAATLLRDQGTTIALPQEYLDAMNAGQIKGFGLEPGSLGATNPDYLVAYGVGPGTEWSGQLSLTIRG